MFAAALFTAGAPDKHRKCARIGDGLQAFWHLLEEDRV